MDALQEAQRLLAQAQSCYDAAEEKDGNAFYRGKGDKAMQDAATYAAVAQAEQMKRIADVVEYAIQGWSRPRIIARVNGQSEL